MRNSGWLDAREYNLRIGWSSSVCSGRPSSSTDIVAEQATKWSSGSKERHRSCRARRVGGRRVFLRVEEEAPDCSLSSPPIVLAPRLACDRAAQLPHTRTIQHHLHHDMHAIDVDTVVDLPGGDNYEDVTRVFAEAANGESCAHYVSSEKSDAVPPTVDMDPEALIMTKTFSLLDAMSAFEVGTVAPE